MKTKIIVTCIVVMTVLSVKSYAQMAVTDPANGKLLGSILQSQLHKAKEDIKNTTKLLLDTRTTMEGIQKLEEYQRKGQDMLRYATSINVKQLKSADITSVFNMIGTLSPDASKYLSENPKVVNLIKAAEAAENKDLSSASTLFYLVNAPNANKNVKGSAKSSFTVSPQEYEYVKAGTDAYYFEKNAALYKSYMVVADRYKELALELEIQYKSDKVSMSDAERTSLMARANEYLEKYTDCMVKAHDLLHKPANGSISNMAFRENMKLLDAEYKKIPLKKR